LSNHRSAGRTLLRISNCQRIRRLTRSIGDGTGPSSDSERSPSPL
jgi:hypothetical protein